MAAATFTIEPQGPFDLRLAAGFGFGPDSGRLDRRHAVAAALERRLDAGRLAAMGPDDAMADVLATGGPRLRRPVQERQSLDAEPDAVASTAPAEPRRARRTWACGLIRYAAGRP
ncbi:hypothetical protein FSW04_24635 [Baekduia soli]|uniref:Uncharacterized protein n=1 Tax=Baekduia soli TaxID=496014 RepID=A0A5B8UBM0_9ACTN|nr:hypothetical protein [Baekduia soli]QEC50455.1 hypothetical protein FSW04_24635 [Baekduia soli]